MLPPLLHSSQSAGCLVLVKAGGVMAVLRRQVKSDATKSDCGGGQFSL